MDDLEAQIADATEEQQSALFDTTVGILAAGGESLAENTLEFCTGIIVRLLETADLATRRRRTMELALSEALPRRFLAGLAKSEIRFAAPILSFASRLDEATLVDVARNYGDDHRLAVARRPQLTEALTKALLVHGTSDVAVALASNPSVTFSDDSIELLARRARKCPLLEEALCGRDDLPQSVSHRLMRAVSMRLQLQVGRMMVDFDAETTRLALRTTDAEATYEVTDRFALSQAAILEVARLADARQLTERKLHEFITAGRLECVTCAFARMTGLEPAVARRVLHDPASETLAVAARAVPLAPDTYRALIVLISGANRPDDDVLDALVAAFEAISVRSARKVMLFHKRRRKIAASNKSEAIRPHEVADVATRGAAPAAVAVGK